ncbi:HTH-type transcriptional regulator PgrR [Halomonadaceae bacterium LMG 33818]|uniref:LysR family transcriptional regulator n=1 Tax=Cernens ardua TaxID=3402176 RepID=UPI003EDCA2EE
MRGREFTQLQALAMVIEQGSFTKAAAHLGITTSTLSLMIRDLEERLELRLLNRTTRSVSPTEAAKRMMIHLKPALEGLDIAVHDALTTQRTSGHIRLNAARISAVHYLAPLLSEFLKKHPHIQVDVVTNDALIDIVDAGFDAGIRLGEQLDQDMIAVRLSKRLQMKVVASPSYIERHSIIQEPRDLRHHRCLTYRRPSDDSVYRWEFQRDGKSCEINVEGPIITDEPEMLTQLALDGVGITYQFSHQVDPFLTSGHLVQLLKEWTPAFPGFYLYYPSRKQMRPPLRALLDYLSSRKDTTEY